ncbi:ABC transporter substrate-binding protein [Bradyrhizobium xenonodulans]|uniref:ABC transporter substrate-binding protein n=1 Tax=Bradyrhizobium xenonodulans TaxID=2736875 RepID=A0ABY7MEL9_9BRAD|nr:ABC transporter substrate-binding protein [Bradyrhizobium xenonodulans]WBL76774.1 ABC transporter substrate-binding protein [Bradyrhizobium xenonodulans]
MKPLGTLAFLGATLISSAAFAQQAMYVAGSGGSVQRLFQTQIIPEFEAKHNVKITYVPGISSEIVAKLQAQRGKQELNVVIVDDGPMYQAIQYGYCDKLAPSRVYNDLYEFAHFGGRAVGVGLIATGIAYNKASFQKKGWAPPVSWLDLTDKKYAQRFTASSLSGTYGVHTLVTFARIKGGGENNIEPGFEEIRKNLAPNVLSWSSSPAQLAEMFQNNEIDVAVWGSSRTMALKNTGFPVEFVYPKEGAVALLPAACSVVQNSAPEVSQAFVQYLVSPEVQAKLATEGWGPTNKQTKLDDKLAAQVPYGDDTIAKMAIVDWTKINEMRADWTNRWNRTIER